MKVGIVTTAKFHYFALARHLQKNGMLARIVCGYPKSKLASEGIDDSKLVSFPWYSAPHMGLLRFGRSGSVVRELEWLSNIQLSRYASGLVQDLDVLIAASGTGLEAGRTIKEKGGTFICDRGAAHIAVQNEILRQEYEALGIEWPGIDPRKIERELAEYELADQIFVPSQQVKRTFVESGVDPSKIEVLRLGAELARFTPSLAKNSERLEVIAAGQIGVQKGIHHLLAAASNLDASAIRVRLAGRCLPEADSLIQQYSNVPVELLGNLGQEDLRDALSQAHLLVLPSIQDGFGMVAPQAMACGTACLISDAAGACEIIEDGRTGWVFPSGDVEVLTRRLAAASENLPMLVKMGESARQSVLEMGGWQDYGQKAVQILNSIEPAQAA